MKQIALLLLLASFIVILFDIFASLFSFNFQINYAYFSIVSFFIYAYIGFYCAKYGNLLWAAVGGGIIGLVDSTFGWYMSSMIHRGQFLIEMTASEMIATMLFVFLTAMIFGLIGGLISRRLNR